MEQLYQTLPSYVKELIQTFQKNGHEIFLVGGSVRNLFLGKPVKDWDFTTSATPEQILAMFPDGFYDNSFGTVGIPYVIARSNHDEAILEPEKTVFEVTTYRTEQNYTDNRHPESVTWGKTIEEDLMRRDFTMNAIALELITNNQEPHVRIIDPYDGQKDIENKIIKTVGDPRERFKEDGLRLLRAIRFATQLTFTIEPETLRELTNDSYLLQNISQERIRDELMKILASDYPYEGIMLLRNTNLLQYILPELLEGEGISQERPGRHHTTDVFTHNTMSLKMTPATNPIVRFATLIHDVAKPRVRGEDKDGLVIFHNHEVVGAHMAREICDRLRFSKRDREKVVTLIRWHMFTVDEHITDGAVRRFIRRIGVDNVKDMIDLRIGDRLGSGTQSAQSWRLKKFKQRIEEQLAPEPFGIKDLVIDGKDIMRELNIKPGRQIGELLQKLFEEVEEDMEKNTREYLLNRLHQLKT
jgi:tRNA nucleotidyltransferase/poly(A) polymerase